jgi:hypothetical protein
MFTFTVEGMLETESITASLIESSLRGEGQRGSPRRLPPTGRACRRTGFQSESSAGGDWGEG